MTFDTSTVFSDLKLGHKGLLSKKFFLRPNWHGSASSYIPSQWVGGKKKFFTWGTSLYPLSTSSKKKKIFLVKMLFSDFFKKNRTFPWKVGGNSEIQNFQNFFKCLSKNVVHTTNPKIAHLSDFFQESWKTVLVSKQTPLNLALTKVCQ